MLVLSDQLQYPVTYPDIYPATYPDIGLVILQGRPVMRRSMTYDRASVNSIVSVLCCPRKRATLNFA